jgi:hypothetical protein
MRASPATQEGTADSSCGRVATGMHGSGLERFEAFPPRQEPASFRRDVVT